jgi:Tol biopolymer transport system component
MLNRKTVGFTFVAVLIIMGLPLPIAHQSSASLLLGLGANKPVASTQAVPHSEAEIDEIIFVSEQDGHPEIYIVNTNGSRLKRLTYSDQGSTYPRWSPNGKHIAFISGDREHADLYVMDYDGSHQKRLTSSGDYYSVPQWWPDSQHISLFSRDTFQKLNIDGSSPESLFNGTPDVALLSPNGKYIAVTCFVGVEDGCARIVVLNSDGTPAQPFIIGSISQIAEGSWSPNSEHLLYMTVQGKGVPVGIINRDGSAQKFNVWGDDHQILPIGNEYLSWSPNGKYIVGACCNVLEPSGPNLGIIIDVVDHLNSSTQATATVFSSVKLLPDDPNKNNWSDPHVSVSGFSWSPDSQRLVFAPNSGHFELDIMTVNGSERKPILVSATPIYDPHWSPVSETF